MFVKVAIDLALDRLFTYKVPEGLKKKLSVGQLLSVPFSHRTVRAFAMAVCEKVDDAGFKIKPIDSIVDGTRTASRIRA